VVLVSSSGKVYDTLEKQASVTLNGFEESVSYSNILGKTAGG